MKLYRHYIWDFDGTLFDSYPHSTSALCATAAHYGLPADYDELNRLLRLRFASAFERLGLNEEQLAYFSRLRGDDTLPPPIVPFPHARSALEALAGVGAKHYLYTHSNRRMSVSFIEQFGLAHLFEDFMTADAPGFASKPAPDAIVALAARHRMHPGDAVMIGDRELDMLCARNAGIDGILIDPDGLVKQTCASRRIDDLLELIPEPGDHGDLL